MTGQDLWIDTVNVPAATREAMLRVGRTVGVRRGQMVLATGSTSDDVYIVQAGHLRVTLFPMSGREVIVRDLTGGQIFGELAAIDTVPRSASIVAISDSDLIVIPAQRFRDIVSGTAEAGLWFARHLTRQIRQLTERIFELSAMNVRGRLHCQLLRMCANAGVVDNQAEIALAPTHEHLAALIGSHREAVTRELSYLASIGLLERSGRTLNIRDVARLAGIVRELTGETMAVSALDDPGGSSV